MRKSERIHIGTSGWHYEHWIGPFYPEGISKDDFLGHYLDHFHTVEINNTFYQLPQEKTLIQWRDAVPSGFIFAVKASRYITHMKKLKDPERAVAKFFSRIEALGDTVGPILFQLPPRWRCNVDRLSLFLKAVPAGYRYAFEFRDPTWFDDQVYEILTEHGAAFCIYDFDRRQSPRVVTADFVYVRLHGPDGPYQGQYSTRSLTEWVGAFSAWVNQGKEVYCYFDNDEAGYAAQDAMHLKQMISSNRGRR
jgi:uncharacterized protein YecE (DUF72 family)